METPTTTLNPAAEATATAAATPPPETVDPGGSENMGVDQLRALFNASRRPKPEAPAAQPQGDDQPKPADSGEAPAPGDTAEPGADSPTDETTTEQADTADPAEGDAEILPTDPKSVQKRIGKLVARTKALEEENARLKAASTGEAKGEPKAAPPVVDIHEHPELVQLDSQIITNRKIIEWCKAHPEGGDAVIGGQNYGTVEADKVEAIRAKAEEALVPLVSRREIKAEMISAEVEGQRATWSAKANEDFPWLKDQESPQFAKAAEVLGQFNAATKRQLMANPQALYLLGAAVEGLLSRSQKPAKAEPRPVPPRVPAKPGGSAPPTSGPRATLEKELRIAKSEWEKTGRQQDFTRVQSIQRRLQSTA